MSIKKNYYSSKLINIQSYFSIHHTEIAAQESSKIFSEYALMVSIHSIQGTSFSQTTSGNAFLPCHAPIIAPTNEAIESESPVE